MNPAIIGSITRHILSVAGGFAMAKGWVDEATMQAIIGGAASSAAAYWSYVEKKRR